MKTASLFLFCFILTLSGFAQPGSNPLPRTITVNGSAELEIVPDEIYVQVYLKEYDRKGGGKTGIEKIRQEFLTAVRSLGLPDTAISVSGYDANAYDPWRRKKAQRPDLHASMTYQVKLRNTAQVDQLVDGLDDNATQNFYISRISHSRIEEYKTTLKIQAVQAAKAKALRLAGAIDEKVGNAITITEPGDYYHPSYGPPPPVVQEREQASTGSLQAQADFKKMKLRYDVTVVFELR